MSGKWSPFFTGGGQQKVPTSSSYQLLTSFQHLEKFQSSKSKRSSTINVLGSFTRSKSQIPAGFSPNSVRSGTRVLRAARWGCFLQALPVETGKPLLCPPHNGGGDSDRTHGWHQELCEHGKILSASPRPGWGGTTKVVCVGHFRLWYGHQKSDGETCCTNAVCTTNLWEKKVKLKPYQVTREHLLCDCAVELNTGFKSLGSSELRESPYLHLLAGFSCS